ncbi:MAG: sensor histidine kinase [Mycobacteriaceae bacterium]|uniref:sensor histidine kinase n=1 Tax=Corynebacterium sp. TaxID=1720 RepID=UPI003F995075
MSQPSSGRKTYPGVFLSHYPLRVSLVLVIAVLTALGLTVSGTVVSGMMQRFMTERVDEQLQAVRSTAEETTSSSCAEDWSSLQSRPTEGLASNVYVEIVDDPCGGYPLNSITESQPDLSAITDPTSAVTVPATGDSASSAPWRAAATVNDAGSVTAYALPMAGETKIMNQMTTMLVTISLVILAVLIAASMFLVRRALQPLYQVEQTAGRIARGHLDQRVPNWSPRTEVGRLSVALNRMLAQIQGAFIAVNDSERQARDAEASMRRFIGDASHELRTPLTSVRGYADLYRSGATDDPDMVMDRISDEAGRMSLLVEDLLTLVRMDEGRPMRQDPVDLLELSLAAAENARVGFPGRSVTVRNDARSVPVTVGDSARLHQVVGNLVTNALRHAGDDASVGIRLSRPDESTVALDVTDDGDGISPDDLPHLFERFYRADVSRSRASGGSGLGLSIAKRLIEKHDGTITVESEPGEGTAFHIVLPALEDEMGTEDLDELDDADGAEGTDGSGDSGDGAADGTDNGTGTGTGTEDSVEGPGDDSPAPPPDDRSRRDRRDRNTWGR